jgi:hypothetical protein
MANAPDPTEDREYVLRMRSEALKDEGILPGDYLVIRSASTAERGALALGQLDPGAEPIVRRQEEMPANVQILGVVVGMFRSIGITEAEFTETAQRAADADADVQQTAG